MKTFGWVSLILWLSSSVATSQTMGGGSGGTDPLMAIFSNADANFSERLGSTLDSLGVVGGGEWQMHEALPFAGSGLDLVVLATDQGIATWNHPANSSMMQELVRVGTDVATLQVNHDTYIHIVDPTSLAKNVVGNESGVDWWKSVKDVATASKKPPSDGMVIHIIVPTSNLNF